MPLEGMRLIKFDVSYECIGRQAKGNNLKLMSTLKSDIPVWVGTWLEPIEQKQLSFHLI